MSTDVKFSIGIPAYKSNFLKDCIDSVLSQTYTNFELIIINDCSPNPVEEVVNNFDDYRIYYYKNEKNVGAENVVNNWNKCLEKASGDFFVLLGDDDLMKPEYLEEFKCLIEKYPELNVFHCRSIKINEQGNPLMVTPSWPEYETVYENMFHRMNNNRQQYVSDWVYRTSALRENGGYYHLPLAWASDDITAYLLAGTKGIAHTQNPVFCYRENSQTISTTGNVELKMKAILMEKLWIENFLRVEPNSMTDLLFHANIKAQMKKYIQKKKVNTISKSLQSGNFRSSLYWIKRRNDYNISVYEVMYAFLNVLKKRKLAKNGI